MAIKQNKMINASGLDLVISIVALAEAIDFNVRHEKHSVERNVEQSTLGSFEGSSVPLEQRCSEPLAP